MDSSVFANKVREIPCAALATTCLVVRVIEAIANPLLYFASASIGPDKGAYYHDLFARGMPEVATYIQRIKSTKGLRGRKRKSQDQEPDFYKQAPPSMAAMIARANSQEPGSPEHSGLSVPTNEAPHTSNMSDPADMLGRLEPTPMGHIQSAQGGIISTHGDRHHDFRLSEGHSNKRQRRGDDQAPCSPSIEESKVNVWVLQPLIPQGGEDSLRNIVGADFMDRSTERSSSFAPDMSSGNNMMQTNVASSGGEGDLWQLGVVALTDRSTDGSMSHHQGQTNMASLPDLEPTPLRTHHDQASRQEQFLLDQQQYEEDQLQQQILRQIDEQQRQLLQQRQNILQRQQMRLQQRQMQLRQELPQTFTMQQQQQQQQIPMQQQQQQQLPLQQQQPLGLADNLFLFEEDEQDDRLSSLLGYSQQQRDQQNQGGFSKHC